MIKVHKSKNNVTVTEIKNAEKYLFYQITFCFTLARKRSVGLPFFFLYIYTIYNITRYFMKIRKEKSKILQKRILYITIYK